jgi:anoctamin-10
MPLACVVNNWIELRTDSAKICLSHRRPIPFRADSIGPWLDNLSFLAWLGNLTTWTLFFLYRDGRSAFEFSYISIIFLLVTVLVAENGYWIVDQVIGNLLVGFRTQSEINGLREDYLLRRKFLSNDTKVENQHFQSKESEATSVCGGIPSGFWKQRDIEEIVCDGREIVSRGSKRRKTQ